MNESKKIPMWKKICYGCGAGGGNVMSTLLASFLLSYYTDTAGIAAAAIGTMFVICRLLDGVTDFAMGGVVDKTNTKLGKARPWLIICAPLMFIGIILILSVPQGWSSAMKLVYAYITYIFLNCIVYTIFGIAHTALLARMTRDFKDRNTTSTVSSIINNAVGLVVGTMITALQLNFGWTVTGIILGAIAGILILIPGLTCQETVGMEDVSGKPKDTVPMKEQLPAVLKNKYFWIAMVLGALTLFANANAIGAQIYYCNVVLNDPMYMTTLMSFGMLPGIIILFFMPYFANKFSKRAFMSCGAILMIIGFSLVGIADQNRTLILLGTILRSVGIGPMFAGLYAFCADAADYGEWKFGVRSEGLMASSQSIGSKIGIGFGSACTAWILAAAGYIQPAMDMAMDGPADGAMGGMAPMIEQPASVIAAIRFDYGWLGAIISVVLLIGVLMMDVEKYLPEIRAALGDRKPGTPV
ncbi:MAG: MFS transporter [Candidatus Onthomonas sp.]